MKTSLGASNKFCDATEKLRILGISRDLAGLEEEQAELRERANMWELMSSTLKMIQDHVNILKST